MTFENSVLSAKSTAFEGRLRHTDDREFPDIIAAELFGVEVKATKKDDWTSIGNSVLESSRVPKVDKIYMFFGKLGGTPDIKFRSYEECLKGIAVTHYPRYQIDMNLEGDQSIFNKMGVSYDEIRASENPIKQIRAYYKQQLKEGDALWWIDDDIDVGSAPSPVIKNFTSLDQQARDDIKADIFILFPEILSTSSKKFERIPAYLASNYGVVSANLRDHFTAGGQVEIKLAGETVRVPQIFGELCRLSKVIESRLASVETKTLSNFWQKRVDENVGSREAWTQEINRQSSDSGVSVKASDLFTKSVSGEIGQ